MTQLLISVRDVAEAIMVIRYPIGILDLKDPSAGALGTVSMDLCQQILAELPCGLTKSIALGELNNWIERPKDLDQWPWHKPELARFQFAKIGLAGMESQRDWEQTWLQFQENLPSTLELVGVAYVDAAACDAPAIEAVIDLVQSQPERTLLLDTFRKESGSSLEILGERRLSALIRRARASNVRVVLAGSVNVKSLAQLIRYEPDFIGVRGAVCLRDRMKLDPNRLHEFMQTWQAQI